MEKIGYGRLIDDFGLNVCEPRIVSYLWDRSQKKEVISNRIENYYPEKIFKVGLDWQSQLRFAFKYEGLNFEVLCELFPKLPVDEVVDTVSRQRVGVFSRKLWFCYEFLTERRLPFEDLDKGNYAFVLDEEFQFALPKENAVRMKRYRLMNNLLGNKDFCPFVYRTEGFLCNSESALRAETKKVMAAYPPDILYRALQYLYVKETRSSFAIEHLTPPQKKMALFVDVLKSIRLDIPLTKEVLLSWQREIVEPYYAASSWRTSQVYVGETLSPTKERVHYIAPQAKDVENLMNGWLGAAEKLLASQVDVIVVAAVLSFAFVFIHPFDDGNGRVHRLLMQYILAKRGFMPTEAIFPISAKLLKDSRSYDIMLAAFSSRLMPKLDYVMSERGEITVLGESVNRYRFIDYTDIVEAFAKTMRETIDQEWQAELAYLKRYDAMREAMNRVVDLPEKTANQFIMFVNQNGGRLSKSKRSFFNELSDEIISDLEKAVASADG